MHSPYFGWPWRDHVPGISPAQHGFTLLESMASLAIVTILLASGVPALQHLTQSTRHTAHINTFVSYLQYSRSEAVKRGQTVVMCRSDDGQNCANTQGWQSGWIVFADRNRNRELDSHDSLLRVEQGWNDPITVTSGRRRRIVYQANGFSPGSNGTYVFCHPAYPALARAVIISNSGRPRLSKARPDGSSLDCG